MNLYIFLFFSFIKVSRPESMKSDIFAISRVVLFLKKEGLVYKFNKDLVAELLPSADDLQRLDHSGIGQVYKTSKFFYQKILYQNTHHLFLLNCQ